MKQTMDQRINSHLLAEKIPARLRRYRMASGLTLNDVAKRCGTTPQTIQRLEMGTMCMTIAWFDKITAALGVKPEALMSAEDPYIRL